MHRGKNPPISGLVSPTNLCFYCINVQYFNKKAIMIIAIPAIVAALTPVVKAALVSAGIGAAVSGGIGAVGGAVEGYQEHGEINHEVLDDAARGALYGARDGALIGAVLGPVGIVMGPVIAPAMQVVDDIAAPTIQIIDDAVGSIINVVDDAAGPLAKPIESGIHQSAMSADKVVVSAVKDAKKHSSPAIQKLLPKSTYSVGYVYVFDDAASGASKIGKSIHPEFRVGQVKGPSGAKPRIVCAIPTYNMKAMEDALHAAYSSQNLPNTGAGREWFNLSASQVKAICN